MLAFLLHLLRYNGFRAFLGMVRRWGNSLFGHEQIVLNSAGFFYARPEKFLATAETAGMRLRTYFHHKDMNESGKVGECEFRYDYIFTI